MRWWCFLLDIRESGNREFLEQRRDDTGKAMMIPHTCGGIVSRYLTNIEGFFWAELWKRMHVLKCTGKLPCLGNSRSRHCSPAEMQDSDKSVWDYLNTQISRINDELQFIRIFSLLSAAILAIPTPTPLSNSSHSWSLKNVSASFYCLTCAEWTICSWRNCGKQISITNVIFHVLKETWNTLVKR